MTRRLSGFELAVYLTGLLLLAAVLAGHRLAVFGLVAIPLLGNTRTRHNTRRATSPRTRVGQLTEGPERSDA